MSLPKISVENRILINILLIVIFLAGIFALKKIPQENFPAINMGEAYVVTNYPGASPSEIEETITNKIEEKLKQLNDVDFISSQSLEGVSIIRIKYIEKLKDYDKAIEELNTELNKINDLPEDARDPVVIKIIPAQLMNVLSIVLSGDFSDEALQNIAEDLKDKLSNIEDIGNIDIQGARDKIINIELSPEKMEQYGLSIDKVINSIKMHNINLPAGKVENSDREMLVRTIGKYQYVENLMNVPINSDSKSGILYLKDIATISDTLSDKTVISRLDGKKTITLSCKKKEEGNVITVVRDIRKSSEEFAKNIKGLSISFRNDTSIRVKNTIKILVNNSISGIILVCLALFVLMGWKNAFLAALAIPFSFFFTFIFMNYFGITINGITLFALLITLGMLVDNAIVILDNFYRHHKNGLDIKEAVIKGSEEVIWPIFTSFMTTLFAFLPMLLMEGSFGKIFKFFPIIVSIALTASIIEAFLILPSNIIDLNLIDSHFEFGTMKNVWCRYKNHKNILYKILAFPFIVFYIFLHYLFELLLRLENIFTTRISNLFDKLVEKYRKALIIVLKHRYYAISFVFLLMILSILSISLLDVVLFPGYKEDVLNLQIKLPLGTKLEVTDSIAKKLEEKLLSLGKDKVSAVVTLTGYIQSDRGGISDVNRAQFNIDMAPEIDTEKEIEALKQEIRDIASEFPLIESYSFFKQRGGPPQGNAVEVRILGRDIKKLEAYGEYVKNKLKNINGVVEIKDSIEEGKEELQIIPYKDKMNFYGITYMQLASTIRTILNGSEVTSYFNNENKEVKVIVRYDKNKVKDINQVTNMKIPFGRYNIPLKDLAELSIKRSATQIDHYDFKRAIIISADVNKKVISSFKANQILKNELSKFEEDHPGYTLQFGGEEQERQKSFMSLYRAFFIALILIFAILGSEFKSYFQPLIVMLTIPFGIVGVIFGLHFSGLAFSITTLISTVALAGVVVNNAIVLIDFINNERKEGRKIKSAIINAGSLRLRPILLTSLTTIAGLLPMALKIGGTDESWRPLAVTFCWGLGFSTLLTLFIIPAFYMIINDIGRKLHISSFNEDCE